MKKYELLPAGENGLHQIRATMAFGCVEEGELGGYIESEANLAQTGKAWVSGNAMVFGNARVFGNALVSGNAWVYGDARVSGNALMSGNARMFGDAQVFGNARGSGNALVSGNAWVYGDARLSGKAWVFGNARVFGDAQVCEICTRAPINITGLYYSLTITDSHIKAGCQLHQIKDWLTKTDRELIEMDGKRAVKFYHETLKPLMMALNLK